MVAFGFQSRVRIAEPFSQKGHAFFRHRRLSSFGRLKIKISRLSLVNQSEDKGIGPILLKSNTFKKFYCQETSVFAVLKRSAKTPTPIVIVNIYFLIRIVLLLLNITNILLIGIRRVTLDKHRDDENYKCH